jgi:hypothetical protein
VITIAAIVAWIQIGQQVFEAGTDLWREIKDLLKDHGIDADNEALDAAILDAEARKARALADATD